MERNGQRIEDGVADDEPISAARPSREDASDFACSPMLVSVGDAIMRLTPENASEQKDILARSLIS